MEPQEFLAAVLPSSGFYCLATYTKKVKKHEYVLSLADLQAPADMAVLAKRDVYFALASFKAKGSREAANAEYLRSLFIDLDASGREYPTTRSAVEALQQFLDASGMGALGTPWVVDSGGGVHAYWPLEKELPREEWRVLAEGFKRLCLHHGLKIDKTVTADAARVLRLPGTQNFKYTPPKPVLLRRWGGHFDVAEIQQLIDDAGVAPQRPAASVELPGAPPKATGALPLLLLENSTVFFKDIAQKTAAGKGCGQLAHYIENAADSGMEPLWRGMLSLAKVCADGDKAARKLSALHPYDEERMLIKLKEIKGPYPCIKFDSENPGVCTQCPHWGRITNPLALGRTVVEDTAPRVVEMPVLPTEDEVPSPAVAYHRPAPPKGFIYAPNGGGVYRVKEEVSGTGEVTKNQFMVLPYDLFVAGVLHRDNTHTAHLIAVHPSGTRDITLPTKSVVAKDDLLKTLAENNIYAAFGAGNDKNLFDYVRACVEEAAMANRPFRIPSQYGWQEDKSFVLNSRIYSPNGDVTLAPMPGLENLLKATRPAGTLDSWKEAVQTLVHRRMYEVLAHGCIGFGAPLMHYTGIRGMTFHAGHKQSGTGKSLALSLCASIWGNPIDYRTGKSTSPVAMQQRAGNLNSLPFVCDELTSKARQDMEWFPSFVFDFSEGRGKERMESGTNAERINNTTWSSLAFFTSNTRMLDYMSGGRQHSSEGEIRRFLEWSPSEHVSWGAQEQATVLQINNNYGVAGDVYARWLVTHQEDARRVVKEVQEQIAREFNTTSDERFWVAGVSAVVAGAILAGARGAGIIDLPVKAIMDVLKQLVEKSRKALDTSHVSAEDILNDYIRDGYGQFVVVRKVNGSLLAELGNGGVVDHSITRTKVSGRVEHNVRPGKIDFFVEEYMLRRHCVVYGVGYDDFKKDLERAMEVTYSRYDMLKDTKGPGMRTAVVKISRKRDEVPEDLVRGDVVR